LIAVSAGRPEDAVALCRTARSLPAAPGGHVLLALTRAGGAAHLRDLIAAGADDFLVVAEGDEGEVLDLRIALAAR
ncbi:MAG TPA: hybrid sensor histidine kinase/response regulator, partial [Acidobacteria bacterium]|nr:hybrid sensor histidine kinase/response regulator [Acidobacteriota bacterium]